MTENAKRHELMKMVHAFFDFLIDKI